MLKNTLIAFTIVSLLSPICQAQTVVFDNLQGLNVNEAAPSDLSAAAGGEVADDVIFDTTTTVTGINWSGLYFDVFFEPGDRVISAADDNFFIRIYSDNADTPGTLLQTLSLGNAVNRTNRSILSFPPSGEAIPTQTFDYSADFNFTFDQDVKYWVSIFADTPHDADNFFIGVSNSFAPSGIPDENAFIDLNPNDGNFVFQGFATDFQLTVVPEPGSVGIFAFGLMGLLSRRKRF